MKYLTVAQNQEIARNIANFFLNGSVQEEGSPPVYKFETMVLGREAKIVMTSVSGHLMNLEFESRYKKRWDAFSPEQLFDVPLLKSCQSDDIKDTLEREVKSCQGLIIWTNCDREGENIGFEIIDVCRAVNPKIKVYRAKFSEITAEAARKALDSLVMPDEQQSKAAVVRQELDLRTGAAFTRFQTLLLQKEFPAVQQIISPIPYGGCQFPTLGFVAASYKKAKEFVSKPFWKLKVTHKVNDIAVDFNWKRGFLYDKEECKNYLRSCHVNPIANVVRVTTKPKNKPRPVALNSVELEKLASRELKINPKTVSDIAQKLYQQGFISYPRTNTNQFSAEIDLVSLVEQHTSHLDFAKRVLEWGTNPHNGDKSDGTHPPIHPIKLATGLTGDEERVYKLIVRHFLACVSKDATGCETVVNITIAGEEFQANGLCLSERNYLDVYPYEEHQYEKGQTFVPEISMQEEATLAPPLLTEADLIALMYEHGIGTDGTRGGHINTIKERKYIEKDFRGFLVPTWIGMGIYEGYNEIGLAELTKPTLRAEFEEDLKKICSGESDAVKVIKKQLAQYRKYYQKFSKKKQRTSFVNQFSKWFEKENTSSEETSQKNAADFSNKEFKKEIKSGQEAPSPTTTPLKRKTTDQNLGTSKKTMLSLSPENCDEQCIKIEKEELELLYDSDSVKCEENL